jgi:transposase InsO family protein
MDAICHHDIDPEGLILHSDNGSHDIDPEGLILHSDNGSPMKGSTMLATLQHLGVMPSFSRPGVSNDNPFSESLFRTLKYRPEYPAHPFESERHAQQWVDRFVQWYNTEHLHSEIRFVSPDDRHYGRENSILNKRGTSRNRHTQPRTQKALRREPQ